MADTSEESEGEGEQNSVEEDETANQRYTWQRSIGKNDCEENCKREKTVKAKSDLNKTGNKKIVLKAWERQFFELLQGDINPVFKKRPGSCSAGLTPKSVNELCSNKPRIVLENVGTVQGRPPYSDPMASPGSIPGNTSRKQRKRLACETEETELLSTSELQRQVLLEQLEYYRLKKNRLLRETNRWMLPHGYTTTQPSNVSYASAQPVNASYAGSQPPTVHVCPDKTSAA